MENFQITEHFKFYEMTKTSKYPELLEENRRIAYEDKSLRGAAEALCETLLEPIRELFGNKQVIISSGYRYPKLNCKVNGSKYSQHLHFQAADFKVKGVELEEVFNRIKQSDLPFGQLILSGRGGEYTWIHISLGEPFRHKCYCREVIKKQY